MLSAVRVLVTVNDAFGHVFPLVPTTLALAAAGHEVLLACPGTAANSVRLDGVLVREFHADDIAAPDFPPTLDRHERFTFAVTKRWPTAALRWTQSLLRDARGWKPDLVIVEPVEHAGRVVAAALGIPWVEHGWGFTLPADTNQRANEALVDLYTGAAATVQDPALRVDLGPASLHATDAPKVDRFRYVPWSPSAPSLPPPGPRPRILV